MSGVQIILDPLVPWAVLGAAGVLALVLVLVALGRGLTGWWLRGLAAMALVSALANPALQTEQRAPQGDIVLVVVDETASNRIGVRAAQTAAALEHLEARVAALDNTELRVVRVPDGPRNAGTALRLVLTQALSEIPRARLAGAFAISDGQVHDMDADLPLEVPFHLLLTGQAGDWDRRLIVRNAPAFAILGEPVTLTLQVQDQGAVPADAGSVAVLRYAINGTEPRRALVPVGEDMAIRVTLDQGGINVLHFELDAAAGELTDRNNAAVVQINGLRDRLSVLLVSGEPSAGQRTWRNLLRSDPSVDLVHFTILRPPDKHDGVPVNELSLIAFPTRELFVDKIEEFDLIIFDRYQRRGILPNAYYENIRRYVERGGALLVVAGPELAGVDSLWRSPLGAVFPAHPTARVIERGFTPAISELGARHPVTAGLERHAPAAADGDAPAWGRWFRLIELRPMTGHVVMEGADGAPLLVLDRVGAGRVALLASDQAWLWDRGFEGGGPQLELLRRLAHWMMGEPDLEEEALRATAEGQRLSVTRRTLEASAPPVTLSTPDGLSVVLDLEAVAPGVFRAEWDAPEIGLYRLSDGVLDAVVALGPAAPREFEETIANPETLRPLIAGTRGGVARVEAGLPELRQVRDGRAAAGRGWMAVTPRGSYVTADLRVAALLPGWAWLLLAAGLLLGAWLREGRR